MAIRDFFIEVGSLPQDGYGFFQLICIGLTYAYILCFASNLISDGSELLLLVPAYASIVGSVVIPVLGAVPDGCIVLFSGLGENAAEELSVGVGVLAGSTIMVLTLSWFVSILGGKVELDASTNLPNYKNKGNSESSSLITSLFNSGVDISPAITSSAWTMLYTSLPYVVLILCSLIYIRDTSEASLVTDQRGFVFVSCSLCIIFFVIYLYKQLTGDEDAELQALRRDRVLLDAIASGKISLVGFMSYEIIEHKEEYLSLLTAVQAYEKHVAGGKNSGSYQNDSESRESTPLIRTKSKDLTGDSTRLHRLLRQFFVRYDIDNSGYLEMSELASVFKDMGESVSQRKLLAIFNRFDVDNNGKIDFHEFVQGVAEFVWIHRDVYSVYKERDHETQGVYELVNNSKLVKAEEGDGDDSDEDAEEIPEDLAELSPADQQSKIKFRAFSMLLVGTLICFLISDPMVDVFSEVAKRTDLSAFFVTFILAPLASNATELIAAYNYSKKKTRKSISIALSTLTGAACMNNTFSMGIFMIIIFAKGIPENFFAEFVAIVVVEFIVFAFCYKKMHTLFDGVMIISLYPLSLAIVTFLNSYGWN